MSLEDVQVHLVDSWDSAGELMRWLGERRELNAVAVDTETTGLSPENDHVRLIQFGDARHGFAVPRDEWLGLARDVVRRYEGKFVLHNAKYDYSMLTQSCDLELPKSRVDDTRVMAHVLDPTRSTALKTLASRHVDRRAAGMQSKLDEALGSHGGWTWATVPVAFGPYWQYAALDVVLTYQLYEQFLPEITQRHPRAYGLEMSAQWVVEKMERRGMHVDRALAATKMETFRAYCDDVKDWCKRVHGIDNPGSNQQVVRALQKLGVQFVKTTPGGAVSLDGDVLEWVADTASGAAGELATAVLRRRQLEKISSTYLSNLLALADDDDVLHPGINPLGFSQRKEQRGSGYGVRTGRMSMENPNLQNLPRRGGRNPGGDVVRSCFTARDGHTLLMCDFDQIEMRIFTHLSQDPGLIAAFHSENDFFVELARRIFRDDTIEKKDPRRQITKNSGYAKIYGAGLAKFAATAGITVEHASAVMTEFDRLFPRGVAHSNGVMRAARETRLEEGVGYVTSPITDRRFTIDEGKEFALVNHQIQGAAAELFKMKLIQLDDAGLGNWLVVPVHDEIISDVPNDDVHDAVHVLQKVMNDDQLLSVPVSASVSHGPSWGDKSDWNGCGEWCRT